MNKVLKRTEQNDYFRKIVFDPGWIIYSTSATLIFPPQKLPLLNVWDCVMVAAETSESYEALELIISPFGSNC